ncbi:MAG: NAD-dependent epimerase/dehydratase family protein [Bdellovibrionales bacterium]
MKVLITGASGFVGQWLVRRLTHENCQIRVLRRKSSSTEPARPGVEVAWGDVTDAESVATAAQGVHTIFHLAGHVGYSRAERTIMDQVNVQGTHNILSACRRQGVSRLVHMSSVVAVGASFDGKAPLNENSIFNLHHLNLGYFETKWQAEQLVMSAVRRGEVDAVAVNPATIYGAGDASKGSRKVQLKVARGKFPFYTGGGVSVIAVEDVVEATVCAWKRGRTGERYILSGDNITIQQLFHMIAKASGADAPRIYLPNPVVRAIGLVGDQLEAIGRKGPLNSENAWSSILFHWFDNQKARRELGLNPQPAEMAIARSVGWIKEKGLL